ncbi:iron permease FTR1/Fip1/EfeU [Gorgonomyces haynaldii]|nr:iron permease FTR1/Fip1/EfeU [Gorgonomyces haynaldii]
MSTLFSAGLFFVVLRETLEVSIIVSVLLSFIDRSKQTPEQMQRYKKALWMGTGLSCALVVAVGAALLAVFYTVGANYFESSEKLYEGIFGLIAALFVGGTGFAFLGSRHLFKKMERKLAERIHARENPTITRTPSDQQQGSIFFWVPFVTVMREGMETVLMIGGVSFGEPATSIPLAAVSAILLGCLIGYLLHRFSGNLSLRWFYVIASYVLFLMAAGIFSRSVGSFEDWSWARTINLKDDDDGGLNFDPRMNIWALECCDEKKSSGFGFLYSLFGYRHIATIGTVVGYIAFWFVIIISLSARKLATKK